MGFDLWDAALLVGGLMMLAGAAMISPPALVLVAGLMVAVTALLGAGRTKR